MFIKINESEYINKKYIVGFSVYANNCRILNVEKMEEDIISLEKVLEKRLISISKWMVNKKIIAYREKFERNKDKNKKIIKKIEGLKKVFKSKTKVGNDYVVSIFDYGNCYTNIEDYYVGNIILFNISFKIKNQNATYYSVDFTKREDALKFIELNFGKLEEFKEI